MNYLTVGDLLRSLEGMDPYMPLRVVIMGPAEDGGVLLEDAQVTFCGRSDHILSNPTNPIEFIVQGALPAPEGWWSDLAAEQSRKGYKPHLRLIHGLGEPESLQ